MHNIHAWNGGLVIMAKKHGLAKVVLGVGAAAVAGKVALDKFKKTRKDLLRKRMTVLMMKSVSIMLLEKRK